jgi:hypothetical protein
VNRDFQYALRRHEYRTQTQQDTIEGVQRRCLLSSSVQDQQLMLQKKRFGDDCAGTPRSHSPDGRDDEMSDQDEPIPHAATMAAVGGVCKSMTQSPTAAELQFAMDTDSAEFMERVGNTCVARILAGDLEPIPANSSPR